MITVLYFASIREAVGLAREAIELPADVGNVADLSRLLQARGGQWASALASRNLKVAVNQVMASFDAAVAEGDEIAFFPPVTGG